MCVCYHDELKQYAWIGLCSVLRPRQHSIGFVGDGFYRSKDPTNSIKILKETECIDLHWTTSVGSGSEHLKRWSEGQKLAVFASSLRCFFTNSPELTTVTVCWPEFHTINSTDRLQSVLNTAARLIVGAKKHDHIKHVLRDDLHWLLTPVSGSRCGTFQRQISQNGAFLADRTNGRAIVTLLRLSSVVVVSVVVCNVMYCG